MWNGGIACPTLRIESLPCNEDFVVIHPFLAAAERTGHSNAIENWRNGWLCNCLSAGVRARRSHSKARPGSMISTNWRAGFPAPRYTSGTIRDLTSGGSRRCAGGCAIRTDRSRGVAPRGPKVRIVSTRPAGVEMETIEVDEVLLAARELLSAQTRQRSE